MRLNRPATWIGVTLMVLLLFVAYYSLHRSYRVTGKGDVQDPAWALRFDKLGQPDGGSHGMAIRMGLAAIAVLFGVTVICVGFGTEFEQLLPLFRRERLRGWLSRKTLWLYTFRFLFCALAIVWGGWEAHRVLDLSESGPPAQLVAFGEANGAYEGIAWSAAEKFAAAEKGYWWCLPYSLIFYAVVVPLLVVVPMYAAVVHDVPQWVSADAQLDEAVMREQTAENAKLVKQRFFSFKNDWYKRCLRYLNVGAIVAVTLVYYQLIGKNAFSPEFQKTTFATFLVIGINGVFFVFVWYVYHDAWIRTTEYLENSTGTQIQLRTEDHPWNFLGRLFLQSVSGYVVLIVLLIPLKNMLPLSRPAITATTVSTTLLAR